jgi:succinyl-CoA synthetase alpha subunit
MFKKGLGEFKYYVGIGSLAQIATRDDRICVLNILGGESSDVTPVGHVWSGGNVVFGTSPGRRGLALHTSIGDIPVYDSVREGLNAGHRFNCGVVYLPPSGARDGVAELIRVNPDLTKIFIVTEKLAVHDSREIRAMGQQHGVDIFGGNSLGVADAWNQVRIGGALGGDNPGESLRKGSIAIFSNSGNFTTTIASYLIMEGWGTTTLVSSGKDVYIQYAAPEFAFALANDSRSKAAVLYVEPGGYYEVDADFTKPVVACVVGRWKSRITRAVGHAGALAGGDDNAAAKEGWFMAKFGVCDIFTPENPVFSARGAVVTNIAHIPQALTAVMQENGARPDFPPEGSLALKPWFISNAELTLPPELDLPEVQALQPYNGQIAELNNQIGASFPRQPMKDTSGASQLEPATQVAALYGVSMLEAAQHPVEANVCLALVHETGGENDRALVNVALGAAINLSGDPALAAAQAARDAGNAPNAVMAAAASIIGPKRVQRARQAARVLIDRFAQAGLKNAVDDEFDLRLVTLDADTRALFVSDQPDAKAEAMLAGLEARSARSVFTRWLASLGDNPTEDGMLSAITTTIAWGPLMRRRLSRLSAENLPWLFRLFGALIGASVAADQHGPDYFCGLANQDILNHRSITEVAYRALLAQEPKPAELFAFQTLLGLLLTGNGPGAISSQGAKGAVSADGPETPDRVQLNKALIGFLTHCGYAHGGNGYEGIAFLIEQFRETGLADPANPNHGLDLEGLASRCADEYARYKSNKKSAGSLDIKKIPGVNHPVFKDKPVNYDPREVFLWNLEQSRGEYNVFHNYYRVLVQALFDRGVSRTVYCVNIDAVIAALLLKILWVPYRDGVHSSQSMESAAFTLFLYARMIGSAAEIDDHLNRGRDMDTRTPTSQSYFMT